MKERTKERLCVHMSVYACERERKHVYICARKKENTSVCARICQRAREKKTEVVPVCVCKREKTYVCVCGCARARVCMKKRELESVQMHERGGVNERARMCVW